MFELHVACPKDFQPEIKALPNVTFTESLDEADNQNYVLQKE